MDKRPAKETKDHAPDGEPVAASQEELQRLAKEAIKKFKSME